MQGNMRSKQKILYKELSEYTIRIKPLSLFHYAFHLLSAS